MKAVNKYFLKGLLFSLIIIPSTFMPARAVNYSELTWRTLQTEHFEIHYHDGAEWSAAQVAMIAEEIYKPITVFYDYEIEKVHINLMDVSDSPGGAAYYYQNRINIDVADYEFTLRGSANWLRNVVTHEFAHLVSLQKAMKMPIRIPSFYLQVINFEDEKRPDVITGYPNYQVSVPFAGEMMPNWLAEGAAQYQVQSARSDIWDSHRDMLLRTAALNGRLLTIDEMGVFGKNSLEAELLYNQGFSLVRFIAERYGADKIEKLAAAHSKFYRIDFNGACKSVLGMSEKRLYNLWKESILKEYRSVKSRVESKECPGEVIGGKGFLNIYPVADGEGGFFYLSNRGRDYSSLDLVHDDGSGLIELIDRDVTSRFSLSPDGRFLAYSKIMDDNERGMEYNDIFIYERKTQKRERITKALRATDPEWSPDGGSLAVIVTSDCSERVAVIDIEARKSEYLFGFMEGTQFYGLSWGKKGILSARFDCTSRDIVLIDPIDGKIKTLIATCADERDPVWDEDGAGFFYSSDVTGIFNIYYKVFPNGDATPVTNVLGGAFSPFLSGESLIYQSYEKDGYKIGRIAEWNINLVMGTNCFADSSLIGDRERYIKSSKLCTKESPKSLKDEISAVLEENIAEDKKFGTEYTKLFVFPRFMIYEKKPRFGLTLHSSDIIDRQDVMAAGSVNREGEYDIGVNFNVETRNILPDFSFEFYRSRKYYDYYNRYEGNVDIRYDLWDAFFTASYELDETTYFSRNELMLRYNYGEYGLNINAWDVYTFELGWNYYRASEISLFYAYDDVKKEVDGDINPRGGRRLFFEATRAFDKLSSGQFAYMFMPIYDNNEFGRYVLTYEEYLPFPLFDSSLSLFVKAGAIDNNKVDDFFHLYLGSRDGLRGYSYYSVGGRKVAMARVTYRFPILRNINKQLLWAYFASVYGGVFFEAGNAWSGEGIDLEDYKRDLGFELRFKGFNFYGYPMAASFEAAYGLDDVIYIDPFTQIDTNYEGKKWKLYGIVSYGF